jgi:hypothetical protein
MRMADEKLVEAIQHANRLREEHNGIQGVYLYLGHDGDNVCTLKKSDGEVYGKGDSGRTLLEAVERAERDFLNKRFWRRRDAMVVAEHAAERFRDEGGAVESPLVFNTACFQSVVEEGGGYIPTPEEVEHLLAQRPEIVRLKGGCHWLVLPNGYHRFS